MNTLFWLKRVRFGLAFCLLGWGFLVPMSLQAAECTANDAAEFVTHLGDTNCDPIKLTATAGITLTGMQTIDRALTINGDGKKISSSASGFRLFLVKNTSGEVIFNDLVLDGANLTKSGGHGCNDNNGGAICKDNAGVLTINRSTIQNNAANRGGGIYVRSGTLNINNSVFMKNTASLAGAVYHRSSTGDSFPITNIISATIVENIALGASGFSGGGIFVNNTGGSFNIKNSILFNNTGLSTATNDCDISGSGAVNSQGFNIFSSTNTCNSTVSDITNTTNIFATALNLRNDSDGTDNPALDAGSGCSDSDYLGTPRPQNGTCDIGAHELKQPEIKILVGTSTTEAATTGETIDLGSVAQNGTLSIDLTIENNGNADLTLSDEVLSNTVFTASGFPAAAITSGNSVTYTIELADTSGVGIFSSTTLTFNTNDTDETSFSFALKGEVVVVAAIPADPSNFLATTISDTEIKLDWTDGSTNEAAFILTWNPDGAAEQSVSANTTTANITGLTCDTEYEFTLLARNSNGDSSSVTATATTNACPPPADPSGLTTDSTTINSATLSWADNSSDETGFILERKTGSDSFAQVATPAANATGFTDSGLACNTTYTYRIKATNSSNSSADSGYSNEVDATTTACPAAPSDPANLNVTGQTQNSISLSWDDSDTETSYILERKTGSGGTYSQVATPAQNATSHTNSGLSCETTYVYRIKAVLAGIESGYSNERSATTSSCPEPVVIPPPNYTLSVQVEPSDGGRITGPQITCGNGSSDCSGTYSNGAEVDISLSLNTDFVFEGWSGCSTSKNLDLTVTMNETKTCTAKLREEPTADLTTRIDGTGNGTLQVLPATGKTSCGDNCTTYDAGTIISLTATPDAESTFTGWTGSCSGTENPLSITLNNNYTCVANFAALPQHPLTLTVTGQGTVTSTPAGIDNCAESCTANFGETKTVSLTPTASAGWNFSHFAGEADCADASITIAGPTTCEAFFAEAGEVAIELANYAGTEGDTLQLNVLRENGSLGEISVDLTATGITADGDDFTLDSTSLVWPNGDVAAKTATLSLLMDELAEQPETLQISLSNVQGNGTLGTQSSAEVKIFDLSSFTSLQIATASYLVNEVNDTVQVIVTRAANNREAVSVDYATVNGTAIAGADYTAVQGTLNWGAGDSTHKLIEIPVQIDLEEEPQESFSFVLSNTQPVGDRVVLGDIAQAEIIIINTPVSGAGLLQFTGPLFEVNENSGLAAIDIARLGGQTGPVEVSYQVIGGTAAAGSDYGLTAGGVLSWPDGDASVRQIPVSIFADAQQEGTETVNLTLNNATNGAVIGAQRNTILNIIDNFSDPTTTENDIVFRFTKPNYFVQETDGNGAVAIQREGNPNAAVSVSVRTQNALALAGQDYTPVDLVVTWGVNDMAPKTVSIPVIADTNQNEADTEHLTVSLYNPAPAGALLANSSVANLHIVDALVPPPEVIIDFDSRVQFEFATYRVSEEQGVVNLGVTRLQDSRGLLRVPIDIELETAEQADFQTTVTQVEWLDGEMGTKIIPIGILNDSQTEGKESFLVKLGQPNLSDALLGANPVARVEIYDQTTVQFSAAQYDADENSNTVILTVSREGNPLSTPTVSYRTLDSTARAGSDYRTASGELSFGVDQLESSFSIELRNNAEKDGQRQFKVRLQNPQNSALGIPSETVVLIIDDEASVCAPPIIDCRYNNNGKILTDARIMPNGVVIGGTLSGDIENFGVIDDSINPIILLPNTVIREDGVLRGRFSGDMSQAGPNDQLPRLQEVLISVDSELSNLIIGSGTRLSSHVKLRAGVVFSANGLVPPRIDLSQILGTLGSVETDGSQALNLMTDVLLYNAGNGILGAINQNLIQIASNQGISPPATVQQDASSGILTLTESDGSTSSLLPIKVVQYDYDLCSTHTATADVSVAHCVEEVPLGFRRQADGSVIFVTHTYRQITAVPVMSSMRSMRRSLASYALNHVSWFDGVIYVMTDEPGYFFAAQAGAQLSPTVTANYEYGGVQGSEIVRNLSKVFFVIPHDNYLVRQYLNPAAAYPEQLRALSYQQQAVLHNSGIATIPLQTANGVQLYHGLLDYLVIEGDDSLASGDLILRPLADQNGDGLTDYEIIYPNGAQQRLFSMQ